jgi:fructose-bisphosphate aldolase class II
MPLATPDQYAAMLDAATAGGYSYAAVNVTSSETLNGALRGFRDAGADGIVQITVGAAEFLSGAGVADALLGARAFAHYARTLAERSPVLIALHTDHCPPDRLDELLLPLIDESAQRVTDGEPPLFNSHMFDGSSLPLSENLCISTDLLRRCKDLGIILEVECGAVGGEEDGILGPGGPREELYTTPADLLRVADALGTGEKGRYLLAATFGNVHGSHPPGHVRLRPDILREGQIALDARHPGARFQYVFHGSSGSTPAELAATISHGVVKTNIDTDAQYAYTRAIAGHILDHWDGVLRIDGGLGDKHDYDPRSWGRTAEAAMADRVRHACEQLGSARRSLALSTAQPAAF